MDRIATICASYCSEVEKYLSIARPGTFPDPDMLVRATCNHLIFQLHLGATSIVGYCHQSSAEAFSHTQGTI